VNRWRHQLPVHSPLSVSAWLAGVRSVIGGNGGPAHAAARLESLLKERYGPTGVVLTESGTMALTAALLGLAENRKETEVVVAMPAYSCYDIATAAEGAGARVILYDLDPRTLAPDLAHVRAALDHGATAVVVAHLYGCPVDLTEINRLAAQAGAVVIEDAAQAAGATMHHRPLGTRGSLGVFSFGRGKGLTGGSGGALLAFDDAGARALQRVRSVIGLSRQGWRELVTLAAQLVFERPGLYTLPAALPFLHLGETIYREPQALRAAARASCAVVAATWALADPEGELRRGNAERLLVALRQQPGFSTIDTTAAARPGYLRLPVVASPHARRAAAEATARRLGVMPGYPVALCDVPRVRRRCVNRDDAFPGSRLLAARLCTFPTHGRLAVRDLIRLDQWIRTIGASGARPGPPRDQLRVDRDVPLHHSI
jgi:dTDP-4-amino-4,6-dideoxygalactose transaminase